MTEHEASRTLVKSPPELWAECSDPGSLGRHLDPFGEIRITRLEPETAVAWEGERARGTVRLEPSGWGTRVTLTARAVEAGAPPAVVVEAVEPAVAEVGTEQPRAVAVEPPAVVVDTGLPGPVPEATPAADDVPVPEAASTPEPPAPELLAPRPGFFARLFGRRSAEPAVIEAAPEPHVPAPEPVAAAPEPHVPAPEPVAAAPEPHVPAREPEAPPPAPPEPPDASAAQHPATVLAAALDSLGQAHHRPFSRA